MQSPEQYLQAQQQQQVPIVLFFSQQCPHCKKFIEQMKTNPELVKQVKGIDVATSRVPPQVTSVPSVLLNGSQLLVDKQAFEWLNKNAAPELGPGPNLGSKGFETSNFSFIAEGDSPSLGENSNSFSMIGAQNGSAGIDPKMIAQMEAGGDSRKGDSKSPSMDQIMQSRSQAIPGGNGPPRQSF